MAKRAEVKTTIVDNQHIGKEAPRASNQSLLQKNIFFESNNLKIEFISQTHLMEYQCLHDRFGLKIWNIGLNEGHQRRTSVVSY